MYTLPDLRDMSKAELQKELAASTKDLVHHEVMGKLGQEKTHHKLQSTRRYIAQIKTIMHGKSPSPKHSAVKKAA